MIAADRWIEDEQGGRVFEVDEMALVKLQAFILRDLHGYEVAKLQRIDPVGADAIDIVRQGARLATVRRARAGVRHQYVVEVADGGTLEVHGHVGRYDYEVRRDRDVVAAVSKDGVHEHDEYGVEVRAGEDEAMLVAAAIAIDVMHTR